MTEHLEATVSESYPVNRTEGSETIGDTHAQVPGGERRQIRRAFAGIWPSWRLAFGSATHETVGTGNTQIPAVGVGFVKAF
jgi:hypothetical protein